MKKRAALLSIFLTLFAGTALFSGDDIAQAISDFKEGVAKNMNSNQPYAALVDVLDQNEYLNHGIKKFESILPSVCQLGQSMKEDQVYHRLGLALHDKGFTDEAAYMLDKYAATRKYSPAQALAKAEAVALGAARSAQLPEEASPKIEKQASRPRKEPMKDSASFEGKDRLTLKNGQVISCNILKKEKGGMTVQMDQGIEMFWSNDEILKVEKA